MSEQELFYTVVVELLHSSIMCQALGHLKGPGKTEYSSQSWIVFSGSWPWGVRGNPYSGLYGEILPERGTFVPLTGLTLTLKQSLSDKTL